MQTAAAPAVLYVFIKISWNTSYDAYVSFNKTTQDEMQVQYCTGTKIANLQSFNPVAART